MCVIKLEHLKSRSSERDFLMLRKHWNNITKIKYITFKSVANIIKVVYNT